MKGKSDARLYNKKDWCVEEIQNWIILRRKQKRAKASKKRE